MLFDCIDLGIQIGFIFVKSLTNIEPGSLLFGVSKVHPQVGFGAERPFRSDFLTMLLFLSAFNQPGSIACPDFNRHSIGSLKLMKAPDES